MTLNGRWRCPLRRACFISGRATTSLEEWTFTKTSARTPSAVVAVTRRHRDARPCCSVRWQSTHWIARREHHGEDERDERVEDEHEHFNTQGSFGTSAGEDRLPVVMEWACLARVGERGKEDWTQQAKHAVSHSDPQICHRNPPLSPAPRPPSIAAQYRDP